MKLESALRRVTLALCLITGSDCGLNTPTGPGNCSDDIIGVDWPVTITRNGVTTVDSLHGAGLRSDTHSDGSSMGFTHLAPLNTGDSLPVVFGSGGVPVWGAKSLSGASIAAFNFYTSGDSGRIVSASGSFRVLQRAPLHALITVRAIQNDGRFLDVRGTASFSFRNETHRC